MAWGKSSRSSSSSKPKTSSLSGYRGWVSRPTRSLTAQTSQGRPPAAKVVGPKVTAPVPSARPLSSKTTFQNRVGSTQSPAAKSAGIVRAAQTAKARGIANAVGTTANTKPASKISVANAAAKAKAGGYAANTKPAPKVSLSRALTTANRGGYNTPTGGGTTTGGGGRTGGGGTTTPTVTKTTPKTAPKPPTAPTPPTVAGPGPLNTPGNSFTRQGGGSAGKFGLKRGSRGPRSGLSITPEMLQRIAAQRIVNRS